MMFDVSYQVLIFLDDKMSFKILRNK